jgi:hypothetical protein
MKTPINNTILKMTAERKHSKISIPMDIVLKIADEFHGDKQGLMLVCKAFHTRYRYVTRHKHAMKGIRNTLCIEYLTRKYHRESSSFNTNPDLFIITHPECQEHMRVIHMWYNTKCHDGLFIDRINCIMSITHMVPEEVYLEYIATHNTTSVTNRETSDRGYDIDLPEVN